VDDWTACRENSMENNNDPARGYDYKAQQARGAPEQASRVKGTIASDYIGLKVIQFENKRDRRW
jgi:hypothetical protein